MATKKITQLPAATAVVATDIVPIVDDPGGTPVTQKSTWTLVRDYILGITGGVAVIPEAITFEDVATFEETVVAEGAVEALTDGIGTAAAALSWRRGTKAVTLTDDTIGSLLTITCPNGTHGAAFRVTVIASRDADPLRFTASEAIVSAGRVAGSNLSAQITEIAEASVNPAQVTFTWAMGTVSGAVGATNTMDIRATVTDAGVGVGDWSLAVAYEILNLEATGVTVA